MQGGGAQTTGMVRGDNIGGGGMGSIKQASPMQQLRDTLGMSDAELNRPENKAVREKFEADKKRLAAGGGNQPEPRMDYSSSQQGRTGYVAGNTGTTQGSGGALRDPAVFPSRQNPNQMVGGGGSTGPWNQGGQPQILTGRGGQGGGLASLSNQAGGFQMPQSMGGGMPMQVTPMAPNQSVVSKAGPQVMPMGGGGGLQQLANQSVVSKKAPRRTLNQMYRQ
tara:strand:- start:16 stop:681 length:666 start_codon:yes stop_codon:yes gene_type:complete